MLQPEMTPTHFQQASFVSDIGYARDAIETFQHAISPYLKLIIALIKMKYFSPLMGPFRRCGHAPIRLGVVWEVS